MLAMYDYPQHRQELLMQFNPVCMPCMIILSIYARIAHAVSTNSQHFNAVFMGSCNMSTWKCTYENYGKWSAEYSIQISQNTFIADLIVGAESEQSKKCYTHEASTCSIATWLHTSLHLLVTPAKLMRLGIARNTFCTQWVTLNNMREIWFISCS